MKKRGKFGAWPYSNFTVSPCLFTHGSSFLWWDRKPWVRGSKRGTTMPEKDSPVRNRCCGQPTDCLNCTPLHPPIVRHVQEVSPTSSRSRLWCEDTSYSRMLLSRFSFSENIAGQTQLKSSVQRGIRSKIIDQYPALEPILDDLMPKKTPIVLVKGWVC
jgi:hypothetical protein